MSLYKNINIKMHINVILPAVLYGCETRSLTLSAENRPRIFENRVLRKTSGHKRDDVPGGRQNYITKIFMIRTHYQILLRWAAHVAYMGERRDAHRVLVWRPDGKRQLGRPRRSWEDIIERDLREVGWGMDWIALAQDRDRWQALVNSVINLQVPYNEGNLTS
jgi:hypothetical protein